MPYCVIFRPKSVRVADGARYRVVVEGVKRKGSRRGQTEDGKISYVVEFFSLKR